MEKLEQIEQSIKQLLLDNGYDLYSLKFKRKNKEHSLEIIVDRDEDISLEDIVEISEKISSYLDEHDFYEGAYTLDVSSLGAEKPIKLEQISKYINRYIYVHIINPIDGFNSFEGTLLSVDDETISLEIKIKTRKKIISINKNNIDLCRFAIKF